MPITPPAAHNRRDTALCLHGPRSGTLTDQRSMCLYEAHMFLCFWPGQQVSDAQEPIPPHAIHAAAPQGRAPSPSASFASNKCWMVSMMGPPPTLGAACLARCTPCMTFRPSGETALMAADKLGWYPANFVECGQARAKFGRNRDGFG